MENIENIENELIYENAYDELSIIIAQQEIIQQKTSILLAINIALLGFYITLISIFWGSLWVLCSSIILVPYFIIPIIICVKILFPTFGNNHDDNGKYFYQFSEFKNYEELKNWMSDEINKDNVYKQIYINSKIAKNKYTLFKWAMWTTPLLIIPILILNIPILISKLIK